jgi:hypothetical protein
MKRFVIAAIAMLTLGLPPRAWADQRLTRMKIQAGMAAAVLRAGVQFFRYCDRSLLTLGSAG